ncbi:hypothetical protein JAAARDRAFT_187458 [Jaapia argillacea MUCL 33604]|uniref:F-box domain-containing protein n=1 Tax=Jaapia argillacea MUCL 33604 TaxID=933084 RepID=A0A067QD35_9AGAM|nr:hypothetical protein JAAARDRAFT_187458 [Jaapia argillacea MUCL 33604]
MLDDLSVELTIEILEHLDISSLLRCCQVCRHLCAIIKESDTLQYKKELALAGMTDGDGGSVYTRRQQLKEYSLAWKEKEPTIVTLDPITSCQFPPAQVRGGVLSYSHLSSQVNFVRLPSARRGVEEHRWSVDIGFTIHDWGADPSQDLLVVVLSRVHLQAAFVPFEVRFLSMTSGEPHPLARVASWKPDSSELDPSSYLYVQISGDYVAIHFMRGERRVLANKNLLVWNWRAGEVTIHLTGTSMVNATILPENYIAVGSVDSTHSRLRVYSLQDHFPCAVSVDGPDYAFSFDMLDDPFFVSSIHLHISPTLSWDRHHPPSLPFFPSAENYLLYITLQFEFKGENGVIFSNPRTVCVPVFALLRYIRSHRYSSQNPSASWKQWAPLLRQVPQDMLYPSLLGTRAAKRIQPHYGTYGDYYFNIWDLNEANFMNEGIPGTEQGATMGCSGFISSTSSTWPQVDHVLNLPLLSVPKRTVTFTERLRGTIFASDFLTEDGILILRTTDLGHRGVFHPAMLCF